MSLKFYHAEYNLCQLTIKLHKLNLFSLLCLLLPNYILCHKHKKQTHKLVNEQMVVTIIQMSQSIANMILPIHFLQYIYIYIYLLFTLTPLFPGQQTTLHLQPFLDLPHRLPTNFILQTARNFPQTTTIFPNQARRVKNQKISTRKSTIFFFLSLY